MLQIESFGLTDIGRKRQNNEDVFAVLDSPRFYALADGMGGHQAGEIAAKLAIDSLCKILLTDYDPKFYLPAPILLQKMAKAMQDANHQVHSTAAMYAEYAGMGTTLSCLLVHEDLIFFGHVGDSRIYRFRDELEQITQDHTSRCQKKKGKITRAIGTSSCVDPEVGMIAPLPDDIFLLCSDGLTDLLDDQEIAELVLLTNRQPTLLCQYLVETANAKGGYDNITVIVLKVTESEVVM